MKFVSGAKRIFPRINGFRRLQSSRDTGWLSSAPKNSEQAGPGMRERDNVSPRAPLYPPPAPRGTQGLTETAVRQGRNQLWPHELTELAGFVPVEGQAPWTAGPLGTAEDLGNQLQRAS